MVYTFKVSYHDGDSIESIEAETRKIAEAKLKRRHEGARQQPVLQEYDGVWQGHQALGPLRSMTEQEIKERDDLALEVQRLRAQLEEQAERNKAALDTVQRDWQRRLEICEFSEQRFKAQVEILEHVMVRALRLNDTSAVVVTPDGRYVVSD